MKYNPWMRGWYRRKTLQECIKRWGRTPTAYKHYHLLMMAGCGPFGILYHAFKALKWALKEREQSKSKRKEQKPV